MQMTTVLLFVVIARFVQTDLEKTLGGTLCDVFKHRIDLFRWDVLHHVSADADRSLKVLEILEQTPLDKLFQVFVFGYVRPEDRDVVHKYAGCDFQEVPVQQA